MVDTRSPSWRQRISKSMSALTTPNKLGYKFVKRTCPHCGKIGGGSGMTRHHFDNCKAREEDTQ